MSQSSTDNHRGAPVYIQGDLPARLDQEEDEGLGHGLVVVGHGSIYKPKHSCLVAPLAILSEASAYALAEAARDGRRCCSKLPERIDVAHVEPAFFDEDMYEPGEVAIEVTADAIYAIFGVLLIGQRAEAQDYHRLLEPTAEAGGCRIASLYLVGADGGLTEGHEWEDLGLDPEEMAELLSRERARPRYAQVRIEPQRDMTTGQLLRVGHEVRALLLAIRGGALTVEGAMGLLRSGLPHLFLGKSENQWLEVKSRPYQVDSAHSATATRAKIELAEDVAKFANEGSPGLLIVGLRTERRQGSDIIVDVSPGKLERLNPQQYMDCIDSRVYPTIEGLRIEQVDMGDGQGFLMIHVPAQPRGYFPFLVHGAVIGDQVLGTHISIVRRRGEGAVRVTPSQIHSLLAAGYAVLARPEMPHITAKDRGDAQGES
jgi:hypothetical protein